MLEARPVESEECSELRTEPNPQSEIDARLEGSRVEESGLFVTREAVPLDILRVEDEQLQAGVRILMSPLTNLLSLTTLRGDSPLLPWT